MPSNDKKFKTVKMGGASYQIEIAPFDPTGRKRGELVDELIDQAGRKRGKLVEQATIRAVRVGPGGPLRFDYDVPTRQEVVQRLMEEGALEIRQVGGYLVLDLTSQAKKLAEAAKVIEKVAPRLERATKRTAKTIQRFTGKALRDSGS